MKLHYKRIPSLLLEFAQRRGLVDDPDNPFFVRIEFERRFRYVIREEKYPAIFVMDDWKPGPVPKCITEIAITDTIDIAMQTAREEVQKYLKAEER